MEKFDYIIHFVEYIGVEQNLLEPHLTFQNRCKSIVSLLKFWNHWVQSLYILVQVQSFLIMAKEGIYHLIQLQSLLID